MTRYGIFCLITSCLLVLGCGDGDDPSVEAGPAESSETAGGEVATAFASGSDRLSPEELEAGRLDSTWRRYVEVDPSTRPGADPDAGAGAEDPDAAREDAPGADQDADSNTPADTTEPERWDEISPETVNESARGFPIYGDVEGPSVARIQILLDMNRFSPGVIDGRWGKNTEKAVYWFQEANGLNANGEVDQSTMEALERGGSGPPITTRTLTEADVSGPFQSLPEDIYDRAEQSCLCYESRREQIAEVFHSTPELLEQLNPGVDLSAVAAGESLAVPAVEPFHLDDLPDGKYTGDGPVARIVVSDGGHYVHALDESGDILFHFPSTLGADYAPSPEGDFSVESITFDPTWHYQPELLSGVDPDREDAVLPAGPNNAVGIVWMQLSKPHYGIHGTGAPETIGYVTSNGCVRLTNWDAGFLGQRVSPGTPVVFRDTEAR